MPRFLEVSDKAAAKAAVGLRTVYVEDYRDGVRTDNQIIDAAFDDLESGGEIRFGQGVTYVLTDTVSPLLADKRDVLINGQGATLSAATSAVDPLFEPHGTKLETTKEVTESIDTTTDVIKVADTSGIETDWIIQLSSDEVLNYDAQQYNTKLEMLSVRSIPDSTSIKTSTRTLFTYPTSGQTVEVALYDPVKNLTIRDLNFSYADDGLSTGGTCLTVLYFDDLKIINCVASGFSQIGLGATEGIGVTFDGCTARNGRLFDNGDTGYGMHTFRVSGAKYTACKGYDNRHTIEARAVTDVTVQGCTVEGDMSSGISTHGAYYCTIIGNSVKSCGGGIVVRGGYNIIQGNIVLGTRSGGDDSFGQSYIYGIRVGSNSTSPDSLIRLAGTDLLIEGNLIDIETAGPEFTSSGSKSSCIGIETDVYRGKIFGNTLRGGYRARIQCNGNVVDGLQIANNILDCTSTLTGRPAIEIINDYDSADQIIRDVTIKDNVMLAVADPMAGYFLILGGGYDSGQKTDNILVEGNVIPEVSEYPIYFEEGYFGANVAVVNNRTQDQRLAVADGQASFTEDAFLAVTPRSQRLRNVTADYTLTSDDVSRMVIATTGSGTNLTVTVPPDADINAPAGTEIEIMQGGAGTVTIAAGSGVTLSQSLGLVISGRYNVAKLIKYSTASRWMVTGALTT